MCQYGSVKQIHVIRRNNPSVPDGWHSIYVDECISNYVQKMNDEGIITVGCCCGHGERPPEVLISVESILLLEKLGYEYHTYDMRNDVVEHYVGMTSVYDIKDSFDLYDNYIKTKQNTVVGIDYTYLSIVIADNLIKFSQYAFSINEKNYLLIYNDDTLQYELFEDAVVINCSENLISISKLIYSLIYNEDLYANQNIELSFRICEK
jgi:hypothetical protein